MDIISRKEAREKGLTQFFTGRPCMRGHLAPRSTSGGMCRECEKLRDSARQQYKTELARKQYQENPEFREKIKERDKLQRGKYRDRINAQKRRYYRGPELYARIARSLMRNVLVAALKEKHDRTHILLGYGPEELKAHLEKLMKPGMSWENYGEWHVDHIKPISAFLAEGIIDPGIVSALNNLQPLWAEENLKKGNNYVG